MNRQGKRFAAWLWLFFLALAVLTLFSLTRYMYRVQRLERVYRVVATQHAILEATRDALAAQLTATPAPHELERELRERQGRVLPREMPVRVPPSQDLEPPWEHPVAASWEHLRPWQVWWLVFFGPTP